MSFANALIGEIYTQYTFFSSSPSRDFRINLSIIPRNAVSVFPLPVGLHNNKLSPALIEGIAIFCGSVKSGNLSLNQSLTGWDN